MAQPPYQHVTYRAVNIEVLEACSGAGGGYAATVSTRGHQRGRVWHHRATPTAAQNAAMHEIDGMYEDAADAAIEELRRARCIGYDIAV